MRYTEDTSGIKKINLIDVKDSSSQKQKIRKIIISGKYTAAINVNDYGRAYWDATKLLHTEIPGYHSSVYYTQLLKLCVAVPAVSGRSLEFTLAKALL